MGKIIVACYFIDSVESVYSTRNKTVSSS